MCGIAGTFKSPLDVREMLDKIKHRGPDGSGIAEFEDSNLGHVRLALLDLSEASAQPYRFDGTVLTFNGEIWNFVELREEIKGKVETTGDTEVLARMMAAEGINCLNKLDGMFAFAWRDRDGTTWLVRDSFGKVPLYVCKHKGGYIWASERKAFPFGCRPISVPSGNAFCCNTGKFVNWYNPNKRLPYLGRGQLLETLDNGVRQRLQSDAPICCLISGGLDSSLILALAKSKSENVTAYTALFDDRSTDLECARKLCAMWGVKLVEVPVIVDHESIEHAIDAIEIPSKAQIEIACLCIPLAKKIANDGFKACLSGEAADELFGGYGNFCIKASGIDTKSGIAELRQKQLSKMSRGNFVRCNKVFMAHGVECRLPFMEQSLVETAVTLSKVESPLNKKLLKDAASGIVPEWIIKRPKDTFQGGSGVSARIAQIVSNPVRYYNAQLRSRFGFLPKD